MHLVLVYVVVWLRAELARAGSAAALEAAGCDTSLRAKDGRTGAQLAERRRLRKEMAEIHGG